MFKQFSPLAERERVARAGQIGFYNSLMSNMDVFRTTTDKAAFLSGLVGPLGPFNLTYFATPPPGCGATKSKIVTTYGEKWTAHYFASRYESVDPVLRAAHDATLPIDWDHLPAAAEGGEDFLEDARAHGIEMRGVTFPLRDGRHRLAFVSLQSNCDPATWRARLPGIVPDFIHFALAFHTAMTSGDADEVAQAPMKLSRREREVLDWASRGKTSWETSVLLGLSEKTVNFYLRNACQKMNAATKVQAAAQAVREGLI
ncbi:autoinducer binding domain-containing protein [Salinarimonas chemoclinalis]|uniref:autoinducer binding domain-containing protein n=1 Tax=Salinarimonas chemoclinalis TaxID=3241599 RepID=UPI003557E55B